MILTDIKKASYNEIMSLFLDKGAIYYQDQQELVIKLTELLNKGEYEQYILGKKMRDSELLRPLSKRQVLCFANTIKALGEGDLQSAVHELKECVYDYGDWKNKKYVSINEYHMFKEIVFNFELRIKK